jgi:hypothetical protein
MTADGLRDLLTQLPRGATLPVGWILEQLEDCIGEAPAAEPVPHISEAPWRERLWTAPAETRLGVTELCEALGRSKSWLYRHTGPKAKEKIPCRRLDGELLFTVGEVRAWIREREEVIAAGPMESPAHERRLQVVQGGQNLGK